MESKERTEKKDRKRKNGKKNGKKERKKNGKKERKKRTEKERSEKERIIVLWVHWRKQGKNLQKTDMLLF